MFLCMCACWCDESKRNIDVRIRAFRVYYTAGSHTICIDFDHLLACMRSMRWLCWCAQTVLNVFLLCNWTLGLSDAAFNFCQIFYLLWKNCPRKLFSIFLQILWSFTIFAYTSSLCSKGNNFNFKTKHSPPTERPLILTFRETSCCLLFIVYPIRSRFCFPSIIPNYSDNL